MIIFICGASSAGKSSVCQALKERLGDDWLLFSMDHFLGMLGDKFNGLNSHNPAVCTPNQVIYADKHGDGTFEIVIGPLCHKLFLTIPEVLSTLVKAGFPIIVDALITKKAELQKFKKTLNGFDCRFVFLQVSEIEITRREMARKDRLPGSALHWLRSFDFKDDCDVILEADDKEPSDLVALISKHLGLKPFSPREEVA